jgi:hypothetical protein
MVTFMHGSRRRGAQEEKVIILHVIYCNVDQTKQDSLQWRLLEQKRDNVRRTIGSCMGV